MSGQGLLADLELVARAGMLKESRSSQIPESTSARLQALGLATIMGARLVLTRKGKEEIERLRHAAASLPMEAPQKDEHWPFRVRIR